MSTAQKPVTVWSWRAREKLTKRWRTLSWKMTEEDAAAWSQAEGREVQKVAGSAEQRQALSDGPSHYTATPKWKPRE